MTQPFLLALMGPTGTGKTALAEAISRETNALLISADAFQVYRGFDIGTNKPARPHNWLGIDLCDPTDSFGVGEFIRMALPLLDQAWDEKRSVIVAGGTGLYIRALFEEYQDMKAPPDPGLRQELNGLPLPELLSRLDDLAPGLSLDRKNPVRVRRAIEKALSPSAFPPFTLPPFFKRKHALDLPQPILAERLAARLDEMIRMGWREEAEALFSQGVPENAPAMRAIGYDIWRKVHWGHLSEGEGREAILIETRQYAKRQRSWLRSEPGLAWHEAPLGPEEVLLLNKAILGNL